MKRTNYPPAKFERFERVTVTGIGPRCGPYRGQSGTVLWRDPFYARMKPGRPGRWMYVVHLPVAGCCQTFFESDLESIGVLDSASAHLGERPEVSFDTVLGEDNTYVEGCYRLPGRFWDVVIFTKADVAELLCLPSSWDSGITGTVFHVPAEAKLNRDYVLRALSRAFGYEGWVQAAGPDSMVLR
jgi:hypothetical protein